MLRSHIYRLSSRHCFPFRPLSLQLRPVSDLGLRSHLPPDSEPDFSTEPDRDDLPNVSDSEWEIRTGRAIFVLQHTLPRFFDAGLVTSVNTLTGTPDDPPSSSSIVGDALKLPISTNPPPIMASSSHYSSETSEPGGGHHELIYSPKIRLSYTPPVALPAPFPKTLGIEGFPLYIASSAFVRHTLKALYADLRVEIHKFVVYTPGPGQPPRPGTPPVFFTGSALGRDFFQNQVEDRHRTTFASSSADSSRMAEEDGQQAHSNGGQGEKKRIITREKSLLVGLKVLGTARVSGAASEWNVTSTYTFSPLSGLILTHVINSIHPAPHQAVYDSLRSNLGKVFGWGRVAERGEPSGLPRPANVQPATGKRSE